MRLIGYRKKGCENAAFFIFEIMSRKKRGTSKAGKEKMMSLEERSTTKAGKEKMMPLA
jgi:hypothetical protein